MAARSRSQRKAERTGPVIPTTSLVASASRYVGTITPIYRQTQAWQKECYRHFEICGEARFAARFFGHALARATLNVARRTSEGWEPVTSGPAADDLQALFNGKDGQAQMLEAIGVHLTVAGECYLVGRNVTEAEPGQDSVLGEIWEIVSILEVEHNGGNWSLRYANDMESIPLDLGKPARGRTPAEPGTDVLIRIWLPHPAKRIEADSPFRSLLPILVEIEWLTKHIFAQTSSRLAGAGILFLPNDMTFPPPPPVAGQEVVLSGNAAVDFMKTLGSYMIAPITNPEDPAALVPIVVMAPPESIDKVKLQKFWSELDKEALNLRSEAIRRFAVGMDLPPEQVLGMGSNPGTGGGNSTGVSHWGAWQIEEATIKMFVEPMLELVVNALTIGYLRKLQDDTALAVRYDTAALRLRPDRSKESRELHASGDLKTVRMLEENGFTEADMPDEKERRNFLLMKLASQSSASPEMVSAALKALGVDLGIALPAAAEPKALPPAIENPAIGENPRPKTPDPVESETNPQAAASAAVLAACESIVLTGLMRAGNRLRSGKNAPTVGNCPAYAVHTQIEINGKADFALDDAFPAAEIILEGLADHTQVVPVLDAYCRSLFASQEPHSREKLRKYLEVGVGP